MATGGPPHNPYGPSPGAPPPMGPPPGAPNPYAAPPAAKPFDPKMVGYILGGCALAILIGVFTKSWMTGRGGSLGIGPLGVEACFGSTCRSIGWEGAKGSLSAVGYLAVLGGLAGAAGAAWMAFLVLTSGPAKFPQLKIIHGLLGAGAGTAALFIIRLLADDEVRREGSISWSPALAFAGVIAAFVFVQKLRPYWPGLGTMPWPIAVKAPTPFGGQPPMGGYGAPQQPPPMYGAPQGPGYPPQPYGAPMGGAPMAPPPGAAPMGPPPGAAPMGAAPMVAAPAPFAGAPMNAPAPSSAPPAGPLPAAAGQNKATIMGAPAPQLAAMLKQQPAAAAAPAAAAQFCPRCGKPLEYVAQYQRWFCRGCNQYA